MLPIVQYTCVADSLHMANDRKPTAKILSHVRRSLVAQQCYASSSTLYPGWIPLRPQSEKQEGHKATTVKNNDRREDFFRAGLPTVKASSDEWATWLSNAFFYSTHLPVVRAVGLLATLANEAVNNELAGIGQSRPLANDFECFKTFHHPSPSSWISRTAIWQRSTCHICDYQNRQLIDRLWPSEDFTVSFTVSHTVSPATYELFYIKISTFFWGCRVLCFYV